MHRAASVAASNKLSPVPVHPCLNCSRQKRQSRRQKQEEEVNGNDQKSFVRKKKKKKRITVETRLFKRNLSNSDKAHLFFSHQLKFVDYRFFGLRGSTPILLCPQQVVVALSRKEKELKNKRFHFERKRQRSNVDSVR